MPVHRESDSPVTDIDVLQRQITALENRVRLLQAAGPSTFQSDSYTQLTPDTDLGQGEIVINNEGVHVPATDQSPLIYQHKDQLYELGGGHEAFGISPRALITRGHIDSNPFPTSAFIPTDTESGVPLSQWDVIPDFYVGEIGSSKYPFLRANSTGISIRYQGMYDIYATYIVNPFSSGIPQGSMYTQRVTFGSGFSGSVYGYHSGDNKDILNNAHLFPTTDYALIDTLHFKVILFDDDAGDWITILWELFGTYSGSAPTEEFGVSLGVVWEPYADQLLPA